MIKGKKITTDFPALVKMFYPDYRIVKEVPLLPGNYLYLGDGFFDFDRMPTSIQISKRSFFNLDTHENIIALLKYFKKVPQDLELYLKSIPVPETLKVITSYYYFGIKPEFEEGGNTFILFSSLSKSTADIYKAYRKIDSHRNVILSAIFTMLLKAQSYNEFKSLVSKSYLKSLVNVSKSTSDIKQKALRYWMSRRLESDLISFLISLRR